ncbi:Uncharacterised protein [Candidatus Bartonella washoeensis]|uniref:Uncharacterized protein n=2 Tax=Candidatus Bartonella washoeensis TaxID=186739 RepID=J0QKS1_9HYPH|nr:hypothetical protein [Bartonella washoeensis]EJF78817.1 hypothetical protein MCQ_01196 [Bartonella washoeensis Sb944nv]EJF86201.1 hypothetical protein MCW_00097 [Bartonella washoeensis 085-0475]SPU27300.1 Uncharacterised protein [Bartonella washoeensis]
MIPLCDKELSNTLVGLYDDYQRGFEIGEQLKLCVDLALSLELELSIHRLSEAEAILEGQAVEALPRCKVSHSKRDETGTVIHMDFGGGK